MCIKGYETVPSAWPNLFLVSLIFLPSKLVPQVSTPCKEGGKMRDPGNEVAVWHAYLHTRIKDSESSNHLYSWNLQPLGVLLFCLGGHATLRGLLLLGSKNNIT